MPDHEVELCHYGRWINGKADTETGLARGPEPDTRIVVLATVDNNVDAENNACAHFAAQMNSPVEWGRCEHPRDPSIHSSWDNDDDDRQIWLESTAELPPGDEPTSWYSVIDIRNVKHPVVGANQGVAADNATRGAFFKAIQGDSEHVRRSLGEGTRAQSSSSAHQARQVHLGTHSRPRGAFSGGVPTSPVFTPNLISESKNE